jgi:hypothetical protein
MLMSILDEVSELSGIIESCLVFVCGKYRLKSSQTQPNKTYQLNPNYTIINHLQHLPGIIG